MRQRGTFFIDGKPESVESFVCPEMSLSSGRTNMTPHSLVLAMEAEPIAALRHDDEVCGNPQDELAHAGYPSLKYVLLAPALTELVFGSYLLREWLGSFTWNRTAPIEYWMDSVTSCRLMDKHLELHGICFSKSSLG